MNSLLAPLETVFTVFGLDSLKLLLQHIQICVNIDTSAICSINKAPEVIKEVDVESNSSVFWLCIIYVIIKHVPRVRLEENR